MSKHRDRLHALLSPSSSFRWLVCHGSKLGNLLPSKSNAAAESGTDDHELSERILRGEEQVTEDTPEVVRLYVQEIADRSANATICLHEHFLRSKEFGPETHSGSCDTIFWYEDELELVALDLKTGNRRVYAEGNTQLMCYLLLALEDERFSKAKHFTGIIVSPYGVDVATYTRRELNSIRKKTHAAMKDDERVPGNHCQWCNLLDKCDVAHSHAEETITSLFEDFEELTPEVIEHEMDVERAKQLIEWGPVFAKIVKHAKMAIAKRMIGGEKISGWKLGIQLANRAWKDPATVVEWLKNFGVSEDRIWKKTLLTPSACEAIMGEEAVAPLTERKEKGVVAVPQRSKLREFVRGEDAEQLFDEIGDEDC